jgi:hypothetical protein
MRSAVGREPALVLDEQGVIAIRDEWQLQSLITD